MKTFTITYHHERAGQTDRAKVRAANGYEAVAVFLGERCVQPRYIKIRNVERTR